MSGPLEVAREALKAIADGEHGESVYGFAHAAFMASAPTPPADDVREALAALLQVHERSQTSFVHNLLWHGATADAILSDPRFEVRLRGTVTAPTVEEWSAQMDAERTRQVEHGYDDAHDAERGIAHLLNWSIDYGRRGRAVAAATLARCALHLARGTVTDASPVAWALFGKVTGLIRHVTTDEQVAREEAEFYVVRPLYAGEARS